MFDHHHAVAAIDQAVQHLDEFFHIGHVQADRGFVQHIQGLWRLLAAPGDVVAHLGQLGDQLDALRLATAQSGRRLPQRQVTQTHVFQQLQWVGNDRHGGKKVHRVIDFHLQNIANVFAAPGDGLRFGVEARTLAGFAQHFHVRQKTHGNGANALAFTTGATTVTGVEAEAVCRVTTRLGFQRVGKQLANHVPEPNVGGRATARGFADGGLVHFQHPVYRLKAGDSFTTQPTDFLTRRQRITASFGAAFLHGGVHVGQQHITRQGRFARA